MTFLRSLDAQHVKRARDHAAGRGDEVEVRLVAALGFPHVYRLDHGLDVRQLDVAGAVGRRMARLVPRLEGGLIRPDAPELDHARLDLAVELAREGRDL